MPEDAKTPHSRVVQLEITADADGQRLDNFLMRHLKGVPKSRIYRLLRKGEVRVNKGRSKPDYRLGLGDIVRIPPVTQTEAKLDQLPLPASLAELLEASILLEDADLLILNKPAGLPVHGGTGVALGVIEAMRRLRPNTPYLELGHRLDRDTSGVLLLAKSRAALMGFHGALRQGKVDKIYQALVCGRWKGGPQKVRAALVRGDGQRPGGKMRVDEDGKAADSEFTPRQRFDRFTLMQVNIGTGRTHQIRVHAAHLGYPLAGDRHYGDAEVNRRLKTQGLKRVFLHAEQLRFQMADSGRKIAVDAPLPEDLSDFLKRL